MVEINNQRKAFLDMLAWFEELITDVRFVAWLRRHCRRELFTDYSDHLANLSLNPKLKINRRRTPPASFPVGGMYYPQAVYLERLLSEKSGRVALQQIKQSVALYLWLIVVISAGWAIDRCSNIWASLPGAGYGQFEHKADSLIAKFKEAANGQRDWCMSRVTAIISALVICIIVCLPGR